MEIHDRGVGMARLKRTVVSLAGLLGTVLVAGGLVWAAVRWSPWSLAVGVVLIVCIAWWDAGEDRVSQEGGTSCVCPYRDVDGCCTHPDNPTPEPGTCPVDAWEDHG